QVAVARRSNKPSITTANPPRPARTGPVRFWLSHLLQRRRLPAPDGRPIYRYRMTDAEYRDARRVLGVLSRSGRLNTPDQRAGALFVAYCAEWFRRESRSTFLKWDDIDPTLFPSVPYASKQELTVQG